MPGFRPKAGKSGKKAVPGAVWKTIQGRHVEFDAKGNVIAGHLPGAGRPGTRLGGKGGRGKAAGRPGPATAADKSRTAPKKAGEDHTPASYAKKHGIGEANAFHHLDRLHRGGKVAHDKGNDTYHIPHGTPAPKAGPAASARRTGNSSGTPARRDMTAAEYAAHHGVSESVASTHLRGLYQSGHVKAGGRGGSYSVPHDAPRPAGSKAVPAHRTVKTSAPRDARESAIHAQAKAQGRQAAVVTSTPQYRAEKSGPVTHHLVGGKKVASQHAEGDRHVVTVHHADGSRSVYRHKSASAARQHVVTLARAATRAGTTRHAVVGHDLSRFDHRAHGLGGPEHRVTARMLGDGKSRVAVGRRHA